MAVHMLFRLPAGDEDSDQQVQHLLSGLGRPHAPGVAGGLYSLVWQGRPGLIPHESWIGLVVGTDLVGWVRFCRHWYGTGYFGQPANGRTGDWAQVDQVSAGIRPLPPSFHYGWRKMRLTQAEADSLGVPAPAGGRPVRWIDGNGHQREGC